MAPSPTLSTSRGTIVTRAGLKGDTGKLHPTHREESKHNRAGETPSQRLEDRSNFSSGLPIANEKKELTLGMRASEQHERATGNWKNAPTAIVLISSLIRAREHKRVDSRNPSYFNE